MIEFLKKNNLKISLIFTFISLIIVILSQTGGLKFGNWFPNIVQNISYPIQYFAKFSVDTVSNFWDDYIFLINVQEENKKLIQKIQKLGSENLILQEQAQENSRLKKFLEIAETEKQEKLLAQVVFEETGNYSKVLVLNKGKEDGVRKNQAVISYNGAVGKIIRISDHLSQVQLLLDARAKTPAMLLQSRVRGILQGSQDEALYLRFIPSDVETRVGEPIISSGLAGVFPKGIALGIVKDISKNKHDLFQTILVEPSTNFNQLEELFIILHSQLNDYKTLFLEEDD